MTKLLKKRSLQSPSFRGSAKRLSSIRNKKNSDNQVSSASSVVLFSTQASTSSRLSLPSFRRPKILSRKKGKNTSSSLSLCELVVEVDEVQEEKEEKGVVEESPSDKIMANVSTVPYPSSYSCVLLLTSFVLFYITNNSIQTVAFFEESKTFMEENVMPKVKETLSYVEEHAQPKVQETWAYLEEQSGQCWGSPGATPTEEEEVIIIDNTVAKKMDLPVVVDADPADDLPMTYLEDNTNEEPGLEAVYQGDDSVVVGFYAEPTNDEVQEEKGLEESPSDKIMANVSTVPYPSSYS